jgi:hypothetical protein
MYASPELKYFFSKNVSLGGYLKYQTRAYDANSSYDSSLYEIGVNTMADLDDSSIQLSLSTAKQDKVSGDIKSIDNQTTNFSILYRRHLNDRLLMGLQARYVLVKYDEPIVPAGVNESASNTEEFKYKANLSYRIAKYLAFDINYRNISVSGGNNILGYTKNIVDAGIKFNY